MGASTIAIIVIGVLVLILIVYFISTYKMLVKLRNKVKEQWNQVSIELKKRFDLIPNMLLLIKNYAKNESAVLKGVIEARNKYNVASNHIQEMESSNLLSVGIKDLLTLSESYPSLKMDSDFIKLKSTLKEIEDNISTVREMYNKTVLNINKKMECFPSNLVAKMFKFEKEIFFQIEEKDNKIIEIDL